MAAAFQGLVQMTCRSNDTTEFWESAPVDNDPKHACRLGPTGHKLGLDIVA